MDLPGAACEPGGSGVRDSGGKAGPSGRGRAGRHLIGIQATMAARHTMIGSAGPQIIRSGACHFVPLGVPLPERVVTRHP
jgi:hypothetical protein